MGDAQQRKKLADQLFEKALDLAPETRSAFLDGACGEDRELRSLVDRLLAATEETTEAFFSRAGGAQGPLWDLAAEKFLAEDSGSHPLGQGSLIDRYRLVREVGRGGMAVVHLAERADGQFEHWVAIKLIQPGIASDDVLRRFGQERQILASIQHPHIARLLDGGVTPDGRPYFVMEYVDGLPIDRYCDEHRLPLDERLRLFASAAEAVSYAHRHLVVHRDIKPSNILVTHQGEVKLLDFGIAKWLDAEAAKATLTRTRGISFLTPAFASPEQVRGEPVTTASDIYQLGLLLYTLLTGRSPYRRLTASSADLLRAITEEPATRPSTAIDHRYLDDSSSDSSAEQLEELSQLRRLTPAKLRRALRGDLDTILLTALRKEPERRYGSVAQLIDDIERYLDGRPITARADSLAYRAGKFVARHRSAVIATALGLLLVFAVVVFATARLKAERDRANLAAERASQEAATAEKVSSFLVDLFQVADPSEARGSTITARELLDRGAERITSELSDQPLTQARLMSTIGRVYRNLGLYPSAEPLLEEALRRRRGIYGEGDREVAVSLVELAILYQRQARYAAAEELYGEALSLFEQTLGPTAKELGETLNSLGLLYQEQGKLLQAEGVLQRALAIVEQNTGAESYETGVMLNNLALLYRDQLQVEAAEPLFLRLLPILEKHLGPDHPNLALPLNNLGLLYKDIGRLAEAEELYRRALGILEGAFGDQDPRVAIALHNLADLLRDQDQLAPAQELYKRSLAILEARLGPEHPNVATSLHSQAKLHVRRGDVERAETLFQRALAIREAALGAEHPRLAQGLEDYAELLRRVGRHDEADVLEQRAAAIRFAGQ